MDLQDLSQFTKSPPKIDFYLKRWVSFFQDCTSLSSKEHRLFLFFLCIVYLYKMCNNQIWKQILVSYFRCLVRVTQSLQKKISFYSFPCRRLSQGRKMEKKSSDSSTFTWYQDSEGLLLQERKISLRGF